jgi:chromosome segregation ATPase
MAGRAPTTEQLLALLERAADELKSVQATLLAEQHAHLETRRALEEASSRAPSDGLISEPTNVGLLEDALAGRSRAAPVTLVGSADTTQAVVDSTALQLQLEAAQAELAKTKANLDEALGRTAVSPQLAPQGTSDDATLQKALMVAVRERDEGLRQLEALTQSHEATQAKAGRLEAELNQVRAQLAEATHNMVPKGAWEAATAGQLQAQQQAEALESSLHAATTRIAELEAQQQAHDTELASLRESQQPPRPPTLLESELAAVRSRRDELNVQLARVEAERTQLKAKVAAHETVVSAIKADGVAALQAQQARLEAANAEHEAAVNRLKADGTSAFEAHHAQLEATRAEHEAAMESVRAEAAAALDAQRAEFEASAAQALAAKAEVDQQIQVEVAKSQQLATKLLETRAKVRELEAEAQRAAESLHERLLTFEQAEAQHAAVVAGVRSEGEAALESSRQDHALSLKAMESQFDAERTAFANTLTKETDLLLARIGVLESELADAQQRGANALAEWQHANTQYAQLHREMLTLLDQRDEARKELAELRSTVAVA